MMALMLEASGWIGGVLILSQPGEDGAQRRVRDR
jgi:hypothetical protein